MMVRYCYDLHSNLCPDTNNLHFHILCIIYCTEMNGGEITELRHIVVIAGHSADVQEEQLNAPI